MAKNRAVNMPVVITALVAALLIVAARALLTAPKAMLQGDYLSYDTVQNITDAADVILVGKVLDSGNVQDLIVDRTPGREYQEAAPYTLSAVEVIEVIKGNVHVGDILTIKQPRDYVNQPEATLYELDGYLERDQRELMFLAEYESSPYSAINPEQGMIEVLEDNTLYSASKYSLWGYRNPQTRSAGNVDTLEEAIAEIKNCL